MLGDIFKLGGGIHGVQPKLIGGGAGANGSSGMDGASTRGLARKVLRIGFGRFNQDLGVVVKKVITPFRQAYNAGDPNGYINQSSTGGESNHLNSAGLSSSLRVYARASGVKSSGNATFAGNPKFVYAGDDYVRFKKLAAINKTYNDKSFGGDESNASFTSLMANY
jgi:hypothetical protein